MSFLVPFGLAAAALTVPLALWYVLRARRPRVEVASTYLWRRTQRSVAAAVPWQRFRPDVTFWLVALAILAGAIALARPAVPVALTLGDHTILVFDTSASMLADEGGPSRLELARRSAQELLDRVGPGQLVSVVEAGPRARILASAAGQGAARRAVSALRPSQGAGDLADAFTLAAALERAGQVTVTYLFTDGPMDAAAARVAPPGLIAQGVGTDQANLAVSRLQAVPAGAGQAQAFVQVRNFGQLAAGARVTLSVNDTIVAEREVDFAPRGTEDIVVDVDYPAAGQDAVLVAQIRPVGSDVTGVAVSDGLSVDDTAWAVLRAPRELTALVVGPPNTFLQAALAAVGGVEIRSSATLPASYEGIDLLVLDRTAAPALPSVPTLYIAPPSPPDGVTVNGELDLPVVTFQAPGDELLVDVELADVAVAVAQDLTAPALRPVAAGPSGPLILAGRLGTAPVVYIGFDLLASNFPLQVAWPVFMSNTVAWLGGAPTTPPSTAGVELSLPVPAGATGVTAQPPGGDPVRLDATRPLLRPEQVGVWRLNYDGLEDEPPSLLAVNADPAESDIARGRPALPAGVTSPGRPGAAPTPAAPTDGRRAFGREILVIVLAIVVAEWAWTHGVRPRRRGRVGGAGAGGAGDPGQAAGRGARRAARRRDKAGV